MPITRAPYHAEAAGRHPRQNDLETSRYIGETNAFAEWRRKLFDLLVETRSGVAIMRPEGDLFLREAEVVEERATGLLRSGYERFVINLAGVKYIGSSGIGTLVWLHNKLSDMRGRLVLTEVPSKVTEVLAIMGLDVFEILPSEAEAFEALSGGADVSESV